MTKYFFTLVISCVLLIGCTTTSRAPSAEEQAMADSLGITVEEMRALSDVELMQRLNAEEMDQGEV